MRLLDIHQPQLVVILFVLKRPVLTGGQQKTRCYLCHSLCAGLSSLTIRANTTSNQSSRGDCSDISTPPISSTYIIN